MLDIFSRVEHVEQVETCRFSWSWRVEVAHSRDAIQICGFSRP